MPRIKAGNAAAGVTGMLRAPVEVGPDGPDPAGVFIAPRLIDQTAFDGFARSLRELIEQATQAVEPLRAATADAQRTLDEVRATADRQEARFGQAAALLASLDERVKRVEDLLSRATDSSAAVRRFEEKTSEAIDAAAARFGERLEAGIAGASARAAEVECRMAVAADAAWARAESAAAPLVRAVERAEALLQDGRGAQGLNDLVRRGERLGEAALVSLRQFESLRTQADAATGALGESLIAANEQAENLRAQHDRLGRSLSEAVDLCRTAQEVMATRAEELRAAIDPPFESLKSRADQTLRGLREHLATAHAEASSAALTLQAQRDAASALAALLDRLEPWRAVLLEGSAVRDGGLPPALEGLIASVRDQLGQEARQLVEAVRSVIATAAPS